MLKTKWLNLQLFAGEGAGGEGGGDGGATTGENASVDAAQCLRELGVPEDKIRKRASKVASKMPTQAVKTEPIEQKTEEANVVPATTEDNPTEEQKTDKPVRMTWEEIMADPEYNKEMQATMRSRLRSAKAAEENLEKLTPALELLARKHGLDPTKMDYDALTKAINEDESYYEDKALEMGVSLETAMKIDRQERDAAREKAREAKTIEEQKLRNHYISLERQSEAMKQIFPNFDLQKELENPTFFRMTSPNVGISIEDAYHAIHRKEIMAAGMQAAVQKTAQKISNDIQSGQRRPEESGTISQAPSVTTFDYRAMDKNQREALKKRIYDAAARGEKVFPEQ